MAGIVEFRDYTIEAEWFDRYQVWAEAAVPWLKGQLGVIDFWIEDGIQAELTGSEPGISPHGQPKVCWIIRWAGKEKRDREFAAVQAHPEWQEIWAQHPNENAYLVMNARFMKAL